MAERSIENPIIDSPFSVSPRHSRFDEEGEITSTIDLGRREGS